MIATTTKSITSSLVAWTRSTDGSGSTAWAANVSTKHTLFTAAPYFSTLRPKPAARPRRLVAAQREAEDPSYRARMARARMVLASDLPDDPSVTLAKLRMARGLSQVDLARAVGTSQPHIAKIESGKCRVLFETAVKIADSLQVSLDSLRSVLAAAGNQQVTEESDSRALPQ